MDINQRINANKDALNRLFSKYRINSEGIDGIREGYARFGASFIGLVADALNDHYLSPFDGEANLTGPLPYDYEGLENTKKKSIWDSLNSILDIADRGAQVLWKFKNGSTEIYPEPPIEPVQNYNFLYIAAAIAAVILLIIFLKR